jgi:hypothetical protein
MTTPNRADAPEAAGTAQRAGGKLPYVAPELVRLGSVRELTQNLAKGSHFDAFRLHKNKP